MFTIVARWEASEPKGDERRPTVASNVYKYKSFSPQTSLDKGTDANQAVVRHGLDLVLDPDAGIAGPAPHPVGLV